MYVKCIYIIQTKLLTVLFWIELAFIWDIVILFSIWCTTEIIDIKKDFYFEYWTYVYVHYIRSQKSLYDLWVLLYIRKIFHIEFLKFFLRLWTFLASFKRSYSINKVKNNYDLALEFFFLHFWMTTVLCFVSIAFYFVDFVKNKDT